MQIEQINISESLSGVINEINSRFLLNSKQWEIARRNMAIRARNRLYAEHSEWLGLDPSPMPLETQSVEAA